jgi:molybdenum cofactor synthesis domain-containing protein
MEPMNAAVITVSDRVSRGAAEDRSGPAAVRILEELGFHTERDLVPDGIEPVAIALRQWINRGVDLVVTTGGTGFGPRDLTPEATAAVVERSAPGLVEAMRSATFAVNPHGMLSRALAGISGTTLVVNLPGSVKGVEESLEVIGPALPHAVEMLAGGSSGHGSGGPDPVS